MDKAKENEKKAMDAFDRVGKSVSLKTKIDIECRATFLDILNKLEEAGIDKDHAAKAISGLCNEHINNISELYAQSQQPTLPISLSEEEIESKKIEYNSDKCYKSPGAAFVDGIEWFKSQLNKEQ